MRAGVNPCMCVYVRAGRWAGVPASVCSIKLILFFEHHFHIKSFTNVQEFLNAF